MRNTHRQAVAVAMPSQRKQRKRRRSKGSKYTCMCYIMSCILLEAKAVSMHYVMNNLKVYVLYTMSVSGSFTYYSYFLLSIYSSDESVAKQTKRKKKKDKKKV